MNIILDPSSRFPPEATPTLRHLAVGFAERLGVRPDLLRELYVVPTSAFASTVNELVRIGGQHGAYVNEHPVATTVPIERNEPYVAIVLSDDVALGIAKTSMQEISDLIEELLHAKLFARVWDGFQLLGAPLDGEPGIQQVWAITWNVYSEYIVNRWKYEVIAPRDPSMPNVASTINEAVEAIRLLRHSVLAHRTTVQEAWLNVSVLLHRNIFDPLARGAALRDAFALPTEDGGADLSVDEGVDRTWTDMYEVMAADYAGGVSDPIESVSRLSLILLAYLHELGISITPLVGGGNWVQFHATSL